MLVPGDAAVSLRKRASGRNDFGMQASLPAKGVSP